MKKKICVIALLCTLPILISLLLLVVFVALFLPGVWDGTLFDPIYTAEYSEDVIAVRDRVLAELEAEREKLEQDLANLPPDGPLPQDWCLEKRFQEVWRQSEMNLLHGLYLYRLGELSCQDEVRALVADVADWRANRAKLPAKEAEGHFDPGEDEIPLRRFEQYVLSSPFLNELESAIDLGVARCVLDSPFESHEDEMSTAQARSLSAELLACRVVLLVEQDHHGEAVATALRVHRLVDPENLLYAPHSLISRSWKAAERSLCTVAKGGNLDAATQQQFLEHYEKRANMDRIERHLCAMAIGEWGDPVERDILSARTRAREVEVALHEARRLTKMLQTPLYHSYDAFEAMLFTHLNGLKNDSTFKRVASVALRKFEPVEGNWLILTILAEGIWLHREAFMKDVIVTAFAIEDYTATHGEYPESLDVLVPEFLQAMPVDPVCGEPLDYTYEDTGGFVLRTEDLPCRVSEDGALSYIVPTEPEVQYPAQVASDVLWDTWNQTPLVEVDSLPTTPEG